MANSKVTSKKVQLRQSSVVIYSTNTYKDGKQKTTKSSIKNIGNNKSYAGVINSHTQRRIRKAVNVLVQISDWQRIFNPVTENYFDFKLTFITLTVSDSTKLLTGKEGYQLLLKPMLQHLKRVHKMESFVWKAELQSNGQIHYHITTNVFIHHLLIRNKWNSLQKKVGLLDSFIDKYGHDNPNSTDIHKVYNDDMIEAYLEKYISKSQQSNPITTANTHNDNTNDNDACLGAMMSGYPSNYNAEQSVGGKVWDCSYNLKKAKLFTVDFTAQVESAILTIDKKEGVKEFTTDYFTILYFKQPSIRKLLYGYQHQLYNDWLTYAREVRPIRKLRTKKFKDRKISNLKQLELSII